MLFLLLHKSGIRVVSLLANFSFLREYFLIFYVCCHWIGPFSLISTVFRHFQQDLVSTSCLINLLMYCPVITGCNFPNSLDYWEEWHPNWLRSWKYIRVEKKYPASNLTPMSDPWTWFVKLHIYAQKRKK